MNWRSVPAHEYFLYARSFRSAAKKLAQTLDVDPGPMPDFNLSPVLSMYRHAIELYLKVIVLGEGGNFLPTRPDELSIHKTKSLSWLGQFVVQIVTVLHWEAEFKAEGIEGIADFKAIIAEANAIDPPFQAFRCPAATERPEPVRLTVLDFVHRLDPLVELLERTADALAAEWDLRSDTDNWMDGRDKKPTIQ